MFGQSIHINFNRRGDSHSTPIGGVVSLILKALYLSYMLYLFNKMITYDDDRTQKFEY